MLGIGIDTGGTCTDAVIYDFDTREILGKGKALTTKSHLETGISNALDELPAELIRRAELLALSTTLATNACVENKGCRAKLLMIGFDQNLMEKLKDIYASYGFADMTQFIILDAKAENLFSNPADPDWEDLRRRAPEYFADCDSVGIVQKHPQANGGRFELTARSVLKEELTQPITIAYDISREVDILKTCASTMLNARLIPLIAEFMEAVHVVMKERGLEIPISIVRSDGTLMSEEMAKTFPVETLLCGPAASVIGGSELASEENALIVDMGGTTTDIAVVYHKNPVMAEDGIHIGQWKTMIKGLYVDTLGLGGDSAVRFKDGKLFLDTVRVIPISVLASQYEHVLPSLRGLRREYKSHTRCIHEFYVLQKDISGKLGYTEEEQKICAVLKEKPLIATELADRLGRNVYHLSFPRLEQDGILMRSGLTPTDMMIQKGDFTGYDGTAAKEAIGFLASSILKDPEEIPDLVYDLVVKRMYQNLARILLWQQFPKRTALREKDTIAPVLDSLYEQAVLREKQSQRLESDSKAIPCSFELSTDLPLIGVGAPIHIFLPRVAKLLHTKAVIPSCANVANALGAAVARKVAYCQLTIKAEYKHAACEGYSLFEDGKKYMFKDHKDAIAFGKEVVTRTIRRRALLQGIGEEPEINIKTEYYRIGHSQHGLLLEINLYASALRRS